MKHLLIVLVILFVTSSGMSKTRYLTSSGDLTHYSIDIALTEVQKPAANAPTKVTKGTTPFVNGFLFDAANELYQLQFQIPDNWDGRTDVVVDLYVVLDQAETAGDVIDWTADYIASSSGVDTVTKASTNLVITEVVLAGCAGDNCQYKCDFTLPYNDANNPLVIEDVVVMEIHRTDLGNVGGVVLIAADAHYEPTL